MSQPTDAVLPVVANAETPDAVLEVEDEADAADVIRILVSTDNHLGHLEKDSIRGADSFIAFEEVLQLAVAEDVDCILLGGNLFDEATPSQNTLNNCIKLLRRYTLGDKPITLEVLNQETSLNYQDPNLNVAIPIFAIHGNRDDPSGFGRLSSLDLLSNSGLINYIGRWKELNEVKISPILLRKGQTQLALYGLGHIDDVRLAKLFENDKVAIERPLNNEGDKEQADWFNLLMLHQKRRQEHQLNRLDNNYLPTEILPEFLNLIVCGHEHESHTAAEANANFHIYQPGSTLATSLSEGEALPKHVGLIEIYKTKFQLKTLPLQTVRPFVYKCIDLQTLSKELRLHEPEAAARVLAMVEAEVAPMLAEAQQQLTQNAKQPTLPLIYLRILYSEEEHMFNARRFGQQYNEQVANAADIVHFKKNVKRIKPEKNTFDKDVLKETFDNMDIASETRVEDVVDRYFEQVDESKRLKLMPSQILSELCYRLVEHNDTDAAEHIVKFYKEKALEHLMEQLPADDDIDAELLHFKDTNKVTHEAVLGMLDARGSSTASSSSSTKGKRQKATDKNYLFNEATSMTKMTKAQLKTTATTRSAARGRGRGKTRGATQTKPTRCSARQQTLLDVLPKTATQRDNSDISFDSSDESD